MGENCLKLRGQKRSVVNYCILCQKSSTLSLTSDQKGRKKIWAAAEEKKDEVYCRLLSLSDANSFKYHRTYECYQKYVKEKTEKSCASTESEQVAIAMKDLNSEAIVVPVENKNIEQKCDNRATRSRGVLCPTNKGNVDMIKIKCIVCDSFKIRNKVKKSCIKSVEKAKLFLQMTKTFEDNVFYRVAHLQTEESIINEGIYYHKKCMRNYENSYKQTQPSQNKVSTNADELAEKSEEHSHDSQNMEFDNSDAINCDDSKLVLEYFKTIEHRIYAGEAFELSSLTNEIRKQSRFQNGLDNRFVKSALIDYFGENVHFSYPKQKNKSAMLFYSKIPLSELVNLVRVLSTTQLKNCGLQLRESLKSNFNLDNKYCDANDLRRSWENVEIPTDFVELFSNLFQIDASRFNCTETKHDEEDHIDLKVLKIKCVFLIICYIASDGRKRTPLHVTTGLAAHHMTRNKTLISDLNRIGLSISYAEVQRYRNGLALYTARAGESIVPLPSHFSTRNYTVAAFDNFDFDGHSFSGKGGTHDTVSVLFQKKCDTSHFHKPDFSKSDDHSMRSFNKLLKCQIKKDFAKPAKEIPLPANYALATQEDLITAEAYKRCIDPTDLAWYLCRVGIHDRSHSLKLFKDEQTIPSWSAFNSVIGDDDRPCVHVGFLPVLPHAVTEYDTVYTALCNFYEILEELDQKYLPVACDEGVYKIAYPIQLTKEDEMKNIFLMLGSFHTQKTIYACIGKYLLDSGIEDILIETNLFGKNVVESALNGVHFNRATKVYFILKEALTRLQLQAFFTTEKLKKYETEFQYLDNLSAAIEEGSHEEAKHLLKMFERVSVNMKGDFEKFIEQRSAESPLFKYGNNTCIMIDNSHDHHKSDRVGHWNLKTSSLTKSLPLFHVMDRFNYSRCATIFLENSLTLQKEMPEVYEQFMNGLCSIKLTSKPFSSVAVDQALEQTINREGKGTEGVIGITNKKNAVAVWNMIFHETAGINKLFQEITGLKDDDDNEFKVHHEFNTSTTEFIEKAVSAIVQYMQNHVNPFQDGCQPLRNLVTGELVNEKAASQLLNVFEIGCKKFNDFRRERLITKKIPMSAKIHRTNLSTFKTVIKEKEQNFVKNKKDSLHQSMRIIDIARERNYDLKRLFSYEISPENMLFDENGMMTKEKNKSELTRVIENEVQSQIKSVEMTNSMMNVVVDVMLYCRKVRWKNLNSFGDFATSFCTIIKSNASTNLTNRIEFVFDDYFEQSVKLSERIRRSCSESIELFEINSNTLMPHQEEKFWASYRNKIILQVFLRNFIFLHCASFWPNVEIVFSTVQSLESISTKAHLKDNPSMPILQRFDIEEADVKIMVHIYESSIEGARKILLLSSDTDVFALALNFWKTFALHGLQELWMCLGTGNSARKVPVHTIANSLGPDVCRTIVAAHHLTGADYTSKVGTKLSSIRAEPINYLLDFGRGSSEVSIDHCIERAEKYMINVLQKNSSCCTFNELRYMQYHHTMKHDFKKMACTSALIKLHIRRALYVTYQQVNCLNEKADVLNPLMFGYEMKNELLQPKKVYVLLPPLEDFVPSCNCTACISEKSCCCVKNKVKCCSFCTCAKDKKCRNKTS